MQSLNLDMCAKFESFQAFLIVHAVRIWYDHKQESKANAEFRISGDLPLSHCLAEVINTSISRISFALFVLEASKS